MSDSATVFHLITRYLDGGAEKTTSHELQTLAKTGDYELHLGFGPENSVESFKAVGDFDPQIHEFDMLRHYNPPALIASVFEVSLFLRRIDVQILHTHSTEAGIVGRLAGRLAKTPIVIHEIHGDPITSDRNPVLNRFLLAAERLCAPMTSVFVAKSERIKNLYLSRGIGRPEQFEIIYHGVDIDRYQMTEQPTDLPSTDNTVLTFIGRIEKGKGLFDLLESVDRLNHKDLTLYIIGDGGQADAVAEEIRRRNLGETVHMLGYRTDIPAILNISNVFVLPSHREGTPRVITEALAAGVPVVSTDIAGIPEQVTEGVNGYLIEPGDVNALTDRLQELINSEQRRTEFAAQTSEGLSKFEQTVVEKELVSLYTRLREQVT